MTKPNILFIITDQQRWDAMGCSGGWVQTPNLDRIAGEGMRFTNCVTNSPVCVPTRRSLMTGHYPHNTGIWDNCNTDLPEDSPTWVQAIRQAGYRTSLFGKTHLHRHQGDLRDREYLMHSYGLDDVDEIGGPRASARLLSHMTAQWDSLGLWDAYKADFDERFATKPHLVRPSTLPLEQYSDVYVGQKAKTYLQDYARPEPWFCWVSFGGPHEPWDTPEPYASMYNPDDMPLPVSKPETGQDRPRGRLDERIDKASKLTTEEIAAMRADYAGNITLIDDQIGEILATIEARGELDNTVIVFTSDHGEMNGDYGLIYKQNFLNGAVRIPLLVRVPPTMHPSSKGAVSESLVEWIDIGPTLVELAEGKLTHKQFGHSLCPVLETPTQPHRDFVISEFAGEIMILDHQWKLALNTPGIPYLLFDVENDPDEVNNLVTDASTQDSQIQLRLKVQEHLVRTQLQLNPLNVDPRSTIKA
ncbi:MAG: sulfatase-like hydrolase/transferase [Chloroflexota bacterium]